ncbi:hypothetical protein [Ligaoa zhengdingensis]|uniref:hypothetical protein n=1 Tax=Ligaoa zhengdingensis TaxID=2763658 RepID=UPI0031BB90BF
MKYSRQWSKLDNAAKIFPPTSTSRDTKVFRFCCELTEAVEPKALQTALDRTIDQFPLYRSIIKKGLFWYYFEESRLHPRVAEESQPLCRPIYNGDSKNLLFEVTYFGRRINLEVYHALSDGTGALHFLRTLVLYYLLEQHPHELPEDITLNYDASEVQKTDDSFLKYYSKQKGGREPKAPRAYRLRGERYEENRIGVLEGTMSVQQLLSLSRSHSATITEFLVAVLIQSIHSGMSVRESARPVVITVPVNLRNYFPSESARNFFGVINVGYRFQGADSSLDAVLAEVIGEFHRQLTSQRLYEKMNQLSALEHNIPTKLIPLALKDPCLKLANWVSEQEITAAFSNVGRIAMPPEIERYIRLFDVFTSTKRLQACTCSFGDRFVVSFTAPFLSADIQRCFFRTLTGMGVEVELSANPMDDERGDSDAVL